MALACRFIFWKLGGHVRTQLGIQSVLGALYASVTFLCIINSIVLQPIVSENRGVMYRERAAGIPTKAMSNAVNCPLILIAHIKQEACVHCRVKCWLELSSVE